MRDILLAVIVFGSIPIIAYRPYVGVLVYVWLSVMNPHRLTWGFTYDFSFAAIIAVVTVASALVSRSTRRPPLNALMLSVIAFAAWTSVSTMFALMPSESYERWVSLMKTQLMVCLIPMLFHRREHLRQLIWVIVLSIAYFGVKGGIFVLTTGGEYKVWGPPDSYIADNNSLAVGLIIIIPLMRYLQMTTPHRYVRWMLGAMMVLCCVAVLGSYSRGALLAAIAMALFLWWKGRNKWTVVVVAIVALPLLLSYLPEKWYDRMETISTYQQDGSAMMRLNAWGTMINLAWDRPLVGGGFELASGEVYARYAPDPTFPPQVAHSIYFQALGEHGFVGLGLYLLLYFVFWRYAGELARRAKGRPELLWAADFGLMMQVSLVGFAVGGAFLSLVNFDVPYYLAGAMIAMKLLVDRDLRVGATSVLKSAGQGVRAG